ncbi:MAG TPA: chemotaxis protein CheW, partial [Burkholderiaceae bacterium]|nr:chemotaxis protein CheW [Burkholderiaceae bacterium]
MLGSGTTDAERKGKPTGPTKEFLTFRLGAEEYGIDILRVQEIRSYEVPTRIANAPHF